MSDDTFIEAAGEIALAKARFVGMGKKFNNRKVRVPSFIGNRNQRGLYMGSASTWAGDVKAHTKWAGGNLDQGIRDARKYRAGELRSLRNSRRNNTKEWRTTPGMRTDYNNFRANIRQNLNLRQR